MSENILDQLRCGIRTSEVADGDRYGFRVTSMAWDSGFRGSGLRVGDLVVSCNGVAYDMDRRSEWRRLAVGASSEYEFWKSQGARDGDTVALEVYRRPATTPTGTTQISGRVLAERTWQDEQNRQTLGPGGPQRLARDEFNRPWADWLERQLEDMASRVLDDGWRRGTVHNSRQMLEEHLAQKPRLDFLLRKYPGPFAAAVAQDWEEVRGILAGRRYEINAEELRWRTLSEQRRTQVTAAANDSFDKYVRDAAESIVPAFPSVDPMRDERATVAGKIVVLPQLGLDDWAMDAGRAWLIATDRSAAVVRHSREGGNPAVDGRKATNSELDTRPVSSTGQALRGYDENALNKNSHTGAYFVDSAGPALQRAFRTRMRYEKLVAPYLGETYEVIGRIRPDPKMLVVREVATPGLFVDPLAIRMGGAVFVDVTTESATFAGEDAVSRSLLTPLTDDASPQATIEAFILAMKLGDEKFWRGLFAPWDAAFIEGQVWYQPLAGPAYANVLEYEWIRAKRLLEKQVYDIRVVAVDDVSTVVRPEDFPNAPHIERTRIEVDHVGLFDGEYRAFASIGLNRLWTLQRRDGGPWRIATDKGI